MSGSSSFSSKQRNNKSHVARHHRAEDHSISLKLVAQLAAERSAKHAGRELGPSETGNHAGKKKKIALIASQPGRHWHSKPSAHARVF
jgi:hypothetical protein